MDSTRASIAPSDSHRADALWRWLVSMKLCRSDKWRRGAASCHHTRVWWAQPHCSNHVSACWPQLAVWEVDEQPSSTNGLMDISPVPQRCASVTFTHSPLSCMVLTQSWHGLAFAFFNRNMSPGRRVPVSMPFLQVQKEWEGLCGLLLLLWYLSSISPDIFQRLSPEKVLLACEAECPNLSTSNTSAKLWAFYPGPWTIL